MFFLNTQKGFLIRRGGAGVAYRAHNPKVDGSKPSPAYLILAQLVERGIVVECR